jgi:hypothetical protein
MRSRSGTGRSQGSATCQLYHAYTAGSGLVDQFKVMQTEIAESWNMYIQFFGSIKNGSAFRHFHEFSVYREIDHIIS